MTTRNPVMTDRQQHLAPDPVQPDRFVRRPELLERLAIGNDKLEAMIDSGVFPEPIRMGTRTLVWLESEVQSFFSRMAKTRGVPESTYRSALEGVGDSQGRGD